MQRVGFDRSPQRLAHAQQMGLPDNLIELLGTHPGRQWLKVLRSYSEQIGLHIHAPFRRSERCGWRDKVRNLRRTVDVLAQLDPQHLPSPVLRIQSPHSLAH